MRQILKTSIMPAVICFAACLSCAPENITDKPENHKDPELNINQIYSLNSGTDNINSHKDVLSRSMLTKDFRSYTELGFDKLKVDNPCYARLKRMKNGNFIMFYEEKEHGGDIHYAVSRNLKVWEYRGQLLSRTTLKDPETGAEYIRHYACPDAVVLDNGDILVVCQYRPGANYRVRGHINGLILLRSTDNGKTWSEPKAIYQGVNWEPYLLQLRSGEIHCYFTDSSRTEIIAKDTGTALIISADGGERWTPGYGSAPYLVIRSKYSNGQVRDIYQSKYGKEMTAYNDQMPAVIQLNDSKELAAVTEEARPFSDYDITFAYSGEDGKWEFLDPDQKGPEDRIEKAFHGAGPYIAQFPSGETVMSYGQAYTGSFFMRMGDARARNFGKEISVFQGDGYWGSILVADPHRLIAIHPNPKKKGDSYETGGYVRLQQYVLNHDIKAASRTVSLDGYNSEWKTDDDAIFIGSRSQAQACLRCSADENYIYLLLEVLDREIEDDDHATIYIGKDGDDAITGACRIKVTHDGLKNCDIHDGGKWITSGNNVLVCTKSLKRNSDKGGYIAEISIPRPDVAIQSGTIRVNLALYDKAGGEDCLIQTSSADTSRWLRISGL